MKYSVIIPAYQCETTLETTVSSIQKCGLTDFEIILVDDGSRDGTPALCDRLATEQVNVRCFHKSNGGVSSARNLGLAEARGDYIWFFDSDDLVDPDSMERATQIIDEHAPDMLIFGMRFESYKNGSLIDYRERYYSEEKLISRTDLDNLFNDLFQCNSLSSSCNKLFNKSILAEHHISFDETLFIMEDFLLVLQALDFCKTVYMLPEAIYRYVYLVPETKHEDSTNLRLSRIDRLEAYLSPFKTALKSQPQVYEDLYFMLLRQKLDGQNLEGIQKIADDFRESAFALDEFDNILSDSNLSLAKKLIRGDVRAIFYNQKKAAFRKCCVSVVKETPVYRWIKGNRTSRNQW